MPKTITVEPKTVAWTAFRPDNEQRRSLEHAVNVMIRWAHRHAVRRRWLTVDRPKARVMRAPERLGAEIFVTLDYAELP